MATLPVGSLAPDFVLPSSQGSDFQLSSARGQWVVLYFYPKDMTPGCTVEACEFRDLQRELQEAGALVVGISGDSLERHQKFIAAHGLTFPLLSDEDLAVAKTYGAFGEKTFMGRKTQGILRTTYLIDPQGKVARVWEKVKAQGHAAAVLAALKELQASGR